MTNMTTPDLLAAIGKEIIKLPFPLAGCSRKNKWSSHTWRNARADALLSLITHFTIRVDAGVCLFDTYLYGGEYLVAFRGGKWQHWWASDLQLECAFVTHFTSFTLKGILLLQELDGTLSQHYIDPPTTEESERLVRHALDQWMGEGRLAKNTPRALVTCSRCPVKRQCDLRDKELGETADWPTNYKLG